ASRRCEIRASRVRRRRMATSSASRPGLAVWGSGGAGAAVSFIRSSMSSYRCPFASSNCVDGSRSDGRTGGGCYSYRSRRATVDGGTADGHAGASGGLGGVVRLSNEGGGRRGAGGDPCSGERHGHHLVFRRVPRPADVPRRDPGG